MTAVWQQIFALDARYNANRAPNHPNFRTLYIRRRNQLLRESMQGEDTAARKQYLKLRSILLQQKYGISAAGSSTFDQISLHSRSVRSGSRMSETLDANLAKHEHQVVPTIQAGASRAIVGGTTISENYAFVGVHHIFDQHREAVSMVRFANNDRSRLCCVSNDHTVSVCNVTNVPPTVDLVLKGHMMAVTCCDWSVGNESVVTSSLDSTLRLWNVTNGKCLRVVKDQFNCEILCCAFQPANNNMVITGNSGGYVLVLNVSTGIYPKGGKCKLSDRIISITFDSTGNQLWVGSNRGVITSFGFEQSTGRIHKLKKTSVVENCAVTSLSWRSWVSREARNPSLLVNCAANVVCIYRVLDNGGLELRRKYSVRHRTESIKSTFCPIMSFRQGACIVTGSEDCCIYFLDIEKETKPVVNKLQGHACPVLGVSFNYDESLLATSDSQGLIIVWKREVHHE